MQPLIMINNGTFTTGQTVLNNMFAAALILATCCKRYVCFYTGQAGHVCAGENITYFILFL